MSDFKIQLAREFAESEEYRQSYADSLGREYLATQFQVIRTQRGLTQEALGKLIESSQPRVSKYEDPDYGRWRIETVRRIAAKLGCWVKISLESYGTLLHEAEHFNAASLMRPSFADDPEIRLWLAPTEDDGSDPFYQTRQRIIEWLASDTGDFTPLCDWLQGREMPGFASSDAPYQRILWAIAVDHSEAKVRDALADRLARLFVDREIDVRPLGWHPEMLVTNAFMLAANLERPAILQPALHAVFQRASVFQPGTGRLDLDALRIAMERNQADARWEPEWWTLLEQDRHPLFPGKAAAGYEGILRLPEGEGYWPKVARAVGLMERRLYLSGKLGTAHVIAVVTELKDYIERIFDLHPTPEAAVRLVEGAFQSTQAPNGWLQEAVAAWVDVLIRRGWDTQVGLFCPASERFKIDNIMVAGAEYIRDLGVAMDEENLIAKNEDLNARWKAQIPQVTAILLKAA